MNYTQTLEFLYNHLPMYHRVGGAAYKANLDNTIALCNLLGNPQQKLKCIHIAGTNGKGSTSHMLASVLQETGLRTGLYTSPHYKDFRERIKINGEMIPHDKVTAFVERYRTDFEGIGLSFFEMTVGLAFSHFNEQQVDIAVIETGMGGRLDSTNVINPLVSVITNIGMDHMQYLGDTPEKIASEKAGIIKEQIPVVIGETQENVKAVFEITASGKNAQISFADQNFSATFSGQTGTDINILEILKNGKPYLTIPKFPLNGSFQQKNVVTVFQTCEILKTAGIRIPIDMIMTGLQKVVENTGLQGRWQILRREPLVICDSGHNADGIREVLKELGKSDPEKLHIVFGMVNDKDGGAIFGQLPRKATYYFCKADIPRGLDAGILSRQAAEYGLMGKSYFSVKDAYKHALETCKDDETVFVGGSIFVVAEIL